MNEEPDGHDGTQSSRRKRVEGRDVAATRRGPGVRVVVWFLQFVTLLLGVAIGAVITTVRNEPGEDSGPVTVEPTDPGSPSATAPPGREVRVPEECLAALDRGEQAMEAIHRGVRALGALDGPRLERVIDELQRVQPEFQRLAEQCRDEAEVRTAEPTVTSS